MRGEAEGVVHEGVHAAEAVVPVLVAEVAVEGGVQEGPYGVEVGGGEVGGVGGAYTEGHRPSMRTGRMALDRLSEPQARRHGLPEAPGILHPRQMTGFRQYHPGHLRQGPLQRVHRRARADVPGAVDDERGHVEGLAGGVKARGAADLPRRGVQLLVARGVDAEPGVGHPFGVLRRPVGVRELGRPVEDRPFPLLGPVAPRRVGQLPPAGQTFGPLPEPGRLVLLVRAVPVGVRTDARTADVDQRADPVRVRQGVVQRQLRAPGVAEQRRPVQPEVPSYGVEIGHEALYGPRPVAGLRAPAAALVPADHRGQVAEQCGDLVEHVPQSGPAVAQHQGRGPPARALGPQPYAVLGGHGLRLRHGASVSAGHADGPGLFDLARRCAAGSQPMCG